MPHKSESFPDPDTRLIIGWREWVRLPEFGGKRFRAKIDTGARTSALHARRIKVETRAGIDTIRFNLTAEGPRYRAEVIDILEVRSSNGRIEQRPTIQTDLIIGDRRWPIMVTLTNRKHMKYRMLIGREALNGRTMILSDGSYLAKKEQTG